MHQFSGGPATKVRSAHPIGQVGETVELMLASSMIMTAGNDCVLIKFLLVETQTTRGWSHPRNHGITIKISAILAQRRS